MQHESKPESGEMGAEHPMLGLTRILASVLIRGATHEERVAVLQVIGEFKATQDDPEREHEPDEDEMRACFGKIEEDLRTLVSAEAAKRAGGEDA